jgi:hypothetical protein
MPWSEQDVRRLLNSLRRPELALRDPMGRLVCELTQSRTPHEAVRRLVERAFLGGGHTGLRLAQLVVRCDLDGTLSHEGVAAELGLSPRQFYRYRTRAVQMLAREIRRLVSDVEDLDETIGVFERILAQLKERRKKSASLQPRTFRVLEEEPCQGASRAALLHHAPTFQATTMA